MKRFHFFPFLTPKGVTYEINTVIGKNPQYDKTQIALSNYIDYMRMKWRRRFPFRIFEPWISWEIYADDTSTRYFFWAPNEEWGNEFWYRLYTQSPELNFRLEETPKVDFSKPHAGMKLFLERDFSVPMRIFTKEKIDTQSALLEFLSNVDIGEQISLQFLMRPIYDYQVARTFRRALRYVNNDRKASKKETELYRKAIMEKSHQLKAEVSIRLLATANTYEKAFELVDQTYRTLMYMNSKELNQFQSREWWQIFRPLFRYEWNKRIFSFRKPENRVVLGASELTGLMRLPSIGGTTKFVKLKAQRVLMPVEVRSLANYPGPTLLLGTNDRNLGIKRGPVHLPVDHLKHHVSIIGGAKTGKSTLVLNMLSDFLKLKTEENKYGLTLIDTQGTLSDQLLEQIPPKWHHLVKVVRFRAGGRYPFNLYDMDFPISDHRKASTVSEIIRRVVGDWNPLMQETFLVASLALLKLDMATLENLLRVIEDEEYCKRIICLLNENDPEEASLIRSLMRNLRDTKRVDWRREFVLSATMARFRGMRISYAGKMFNQQTNCIRWRQALDEGHIVVLDLAANPFYERQLFGTASYVLFRQAMITREREFNAGKQMPLHLLAMDEASLYANCFDNLEFVLNEARKYNVPFILSNQGIKAHLSESGAETIFRNFNTIFAFQQGNPSDGKIVAENMLNYDITARDYTSIEPPGSYLQMTVDNEKMKAFNLMSRPAPNPVHDVEVDQMALNALHAAQEIEEKEAERKRKLQKKYWQDIEGKVMQLNQRLEQMETADTSEDTDDFVDIFYED